MNWFLCVWHNSLGVEKYFKHLPHESKKKKKFVSHEKLVWFSNGYDIVPQ